jgi:predicted RNA-binding protein YlxR (DUF448 family)
MPAHAQNDLLDAGPRKAAGAERYCAASGEVKPVDALIRYVVAPDGTVVPDLKRRLPGRGIWVTATRHALAKAVARKAFARGFKRDVAVTPDLVVLTDRLIEQAALDALAICHKAGRVAIGFGKTETALARSPVVGLLHAADASSEGRRKLASALQHRDDAARIAVINTLSSAHLDLALGGQMWYMLPCSPVPRARCSWHARRASITFGPDRCRDRPISERTASRPGCGAPA